MRIITAISLFLLLTIGARAQVLSPGVDSIPMSDNKKLAADIYIPQGWTSGPVILVQTPYNRLWYRLIGLPLVGTNINSSNYAFVIVDWRGFYGSTAANYSGAPTRGEDGYDVVEWIAAQSWSNGKVGTWGPSALGRVQFMTAKENPPHLTCICPLVAGPQYSYQEYFPNGCYRTEYVEQLDGLGFGMSTMLLQNQVYNNFWQFIVEPPNFYPTQIQVPALMIGGWYDHNIEVMLEFYNAIRAQSPLAVRDQHRLLMGPWAHGGNGSATVGSGQQGQLFYPNAVGWNDSLALMFFDYHLRSQTNGWNNTPFVQYYNMGQNVWTSSPTWPPSGISNLTYYFQSDSSMTSSAPASSSGSLSFSYDPTNPSPTVGGPTLRADLDQGPYDQALVVESRNDVLRFTTAPLASNINVSGNVVVTLKVSSDRYDTDFCVRLCDVYPDGRSMLVNDGVYRMRFRNGFTANDTAALVPNQVYTVNIELPATSHTFLQGHRIRMDVTSSNYPRFNRNMNTNGPMYPFTNGDTLINPLVANNTVYTNSINSSSITLPTGITNVGIQPQPKTTSTIRIFPNPADDATAVVLPEVSSGFAYIRDVQGRVLQTQNYSGNTVQLSTSELADGIYLIEIIQPQSRYTSTFVIRH